VSFGTPPSQGTHRLATSSLAIGDAAMRAV